MEEGYVGLSGDRLGQERLARARHADEQGSLWNPCAHLDEFLRVLEVIDYLEELVFSFLLPSDVLEGSLLRRFHVALRLAFPEAEGLIVALDLPQHEPDNENSEEPGRKFDDDLPGARAL